MVSLAVAILALAACARASAEHSYVQTAKGMEPTILKDDSFVVDKTFDDLQRGQILLFHTPDAVGNDRPDVKRIVGLPGDTIASSDGALTVNGQAVTEPYIAAGSSPLDIPEVTVEPGHYFMLGDNRDNSRDSRFYGSIERDLIVGVVTAVVAPVSSQKTFDDTGQSG